MFIWTPRTAGGTNYSVENVGGGGPAITMAKKLVNYQPSPYDGIALAVIDPDEEVTLTPAVEALETKFTTRTDIITGVEKMSVVDALVLAIEMAGRHKRGVVVAYDGMWIGNVGNDYTASSGNPPIARFRRQASTSPSNVTEDQVFYVPYSRAGIASILRALKVYDGTVAGLYYEIGVERASERWEDRGRQTPAPAYGSNPSADAFILNTINAASKTLIELL
jgi:hypothetical protein